LIKLLGGGAGASAAAQDAANIRFVYGQSVVTGLLAAYFALQKLRNERPAWLWYALAGALPGAVLLAAQGLTRYAGTSLADLAQIFSPDVKALVAPTDVAPIRHALIVLVVGCVITSLAGLRAALRRSGDEDD
jgi:hypothetical protein